jgi:hypothetical protein
MRKPNALKGAKTRKLVYGGGYPEHRRTMEFGPQGVKGKLCRCATDGDIVKCLLDRKNAHGNKKPRISPNLVYGGLDLRLRLAHNCITESVEAVESCCLSFKEGKRPEAADLRDFIIQSYTDKKLGPPVPGSGDTPFQYLRKLRAWRSRRSGPNNIKASWEKRASEVRRRAVLLADNL